MVRMIVGAAFLALGILGVLDALLNPTAFKGEATSAARGFLLVLVIPGSLLFIFGRRARARRFKKIATENSGGGTVTPRPTAGGATSGASTAYAGPPVRDLTQEDVIRELQRLGKSREAADAAVQAALVMASVLDRQQINAMYHSDPPVTADNLALKWAVHCVYHGARLQRM